MVRGYPARGMARRAGPSERQRQQVRGAGLNRRSRTIASARETITIDRVRAPHKGGGPRKFDIGEQSRAPPLADPPKRSSTGSELTRTPYCPPFAGGRGGTPAEKTRRRAPTTRRAPVAPCATAATRSR